MRIGGSRLSPSLTVDGDNSCRRRLCTRYFCRSKSFPPAIGLALVTMIVVIASCFSSVRAAPTRVSKPIVGLVSRSGSTPPDCDQWPPLRNQWQSSQACYSGSSSCCKLYDDMLKTIVQLCSRCDIADKDFFAGLFHRYCVGNNVPATALPPCTNPPAITTSTTTATITTTAVHTGTGGGGQPCTGCTTAPPPCTTCTTAPPPCTACTTAPPPCTACTTAPPPCTTCTTAPPPTCPGNCPCYNYYCTCNQQITCDTSTTPPSSGGQGSNTDGNSPPYRNDCIHGSATVTLINAQQHRTPRLVRHLRVGDSVLTSHSSASTVFMFTHHDAHKASSFIKFTVSSNTSLAVTEGHYLHTSYGLIVAGRVQVGHHLLTAEGKYLPVVAVQRFVDVGLYNPQTLHGDIVVNGFRVSTYTTAISYPTAHSLLAPLRAFYRVYGAHISSLFP